MTIGDQVFTANQDVRGTTKKRQWTFTSEGKGGEDKLVYKEFMPAPGICCGCCEQRNIMMVWKGDKPSGKPSGILALPPKGERKQGVKMNVLDAEGNVIYSIRDPPPPQRRRSRQENLAISQWSCVVVAPVEDVVARMDATYPRLARAQR